ncbi:methylated-DNA--[protein]-cysteine S-methyltransferase [Pseudonocardia sp. TRM90224]|uniref:methylated-DNA--[protein]-cysteine S-methyltransferase n=1 Tax=Pseudonocardia sp. TRM90224 TaxID=2812678 RepID=UPI001E311C22|nr:methylated-DNA--[protein]-cysteine S-methyltransferase [Pseudonocardia sp. TRM90224]
MDTRVQLDTPLGPMGLAASALGLVRCSFRAAARPAPVDPQARRWLDVADEELTAYFAGELTTFTVPVDLRRLDPLHRLILDGPRSVPYGTTTTYGELAAAVGLTEDGPRQVGVAMARNPVLVVVPCHRVLGAGGTLTGYSGGLPRKRTLLDMESKVPALW